jgi:hypothetical protein
MASKRIGFLATAAAALVAGSALTVGVSPASAWPIPFTAEQQRFIDHSRAAGFPGNDDAIMTAGLQACRVLYTGQGQDAAVAAVTAPYGASPAQASALVGAARGTMCTQAPG